jgi:hypothetical protein
VCAVCLRLPVACVRLCSLGSVLSSAGCVHTVYFGVCVCVCGRTRSLETDTSPVYLEVGAHQCPLEQMRNKDPSEGSGPIGGHTRSGIFLPPLPPSVILPLSTSRDCPVPVVSGVSPGWSHVTSVFVPRPARVPAA